jgi:hypothetical protein
VHITAEDFNHWSNKSITLLGMSGVGKTRLANLLRSEDWFHYSGDYRIGTRYLDEPILDDIKKRVMQVPFLCDLLRSDSIYIRNNITVNNLNPVSSFMGKLGNPEQGGLDLEEFKRRQRLHEAAEIAAMKDIPEFIKKAREIYGYQHFINDAGGSICELDDQEVLNVIAENTLIIYIKASEEDEVELIRRAQQAPKPLYYREDFLDEQLQQYQEQNNLDYVASIDPDDFARSIFPKLFKSRIPRYEAIAKKYGYTISTKELAQVSSEEDFMQLIETALSR